MIVVEELTVHYGTLVALSDVSFTLGNSRVCALVGVNGSGKSTLFKSILGIEQPSSGQIHIDGQTPQRARSAGLAAYVPQSEQVDWNFPISVREVVMMGRYGKQGTLRRASLADRAAVTTALEQVELTEFAHRQIGELSGGQKKRVFVARALAQEASTLLLDEPFAGVDQRSQHTITTVLRNIAAAGKTVLVSTHDLPAVPALADEVLLLMKRVIAHGTPGTTLTPTLLAEAFGLDPLASHTGVTP